MTGTDNRALRAEQRRRDRTYAAAYAAGLGGAPADPEWTDDDILDAYRAGVDERQRQRIDRRAGRFAGARRKATRVVRRPRVRRWARRHPWGAAGASAVIVAALVVLVAVAFIAALMWVLGRGVASLARTVRDIAGAWSPSTPDRVPGGPGEDPF